MQAQSENVELGVHSLATASSKRWYALGGLEPSVAAASRSRPRLESPERTETFEHGLALQLVTVGFGRGLRSECGGRLDELILGGCQ